MVVSESWVLSLGVKSKAWKKTGEKYISKESRQNLAETDRGSYYNQEEWSEEFLDNEGGFYNGSESDGSDNDDEIYNENNEQQQLSEGFANNCYKIVSPILLQELINDFAVNHQPPFPTCYYSPWTPQTGTQEKQTRE